MRSFFSKLNFLFIQLDLFQFGINLRLKKFDKTTTALGKLMTLGILIFIGYFIFTSDLLNKTNPIVMTQEIEITSRPLINLNENNFTFVLAISDESGKNFIPDPSYFTIEILSLEYESVTSAGYNLTNQELKTYHFCNETDFPRMPNLYKDLSLKNAICLDEKNISVQGYWDEKYVKYFYIAARACVNYTTENSVICQSQEEIKNFFFSKYFTIWIEKKNIDLNNYETPINSLIKSYYKSIDTESSKSIYYYLQKTEILTEEFLNDINLESYTNTRIDFDSSDRSSTGLLFSFLLYSDDKIKRISRKYQNIKNLLASIGGIVNILIIVGTFMAKIQNSLNVKNEIINELYLYPNFKKKQKKNKNKMEFSNNLPSPLNYNENNNSSKKNPPSGKSSLKIKDFDIFTREKHNKHKYFFGLFHYFYLFFKRKKKFTEQEKLFKKGEDLYYKDVDIIEILKKIKEIDKLKFILLDPTQRFLFNLLSKPMINANQEFKNEINTHTSSKTTSMDNSINSNQSIKQNYYNLLKRNNKSEIDERILSLIDKNVYNFIKFNN